MPRLPFPRPDAAARSTSEGEVEAKGSKVMSVGQAAGLVRAVVGELPSGLKVSGEVSNLSQRGHWFFRLKDDAAVLDCVMFATAAGRVGFEVEAGMEVVATGRVDFYPPQGRLQLYVDALEPVGQGALELRLRAMVDALRELGYFAAERKKRLPTMPGVVAVVTSRNAAALQDVVDTARRRWKGCRLVLVDVRVQGVSAAGEIAAGLALVGRQAQAVGIEAVVLTRGGGSLEDLWAFNERVVADAVYACELPVVAAIGHETDTTVAELVADQRGATPTQAAMAVVPEAETLTQQIDQLEARLGVALKQYTKRSAEQWVTHRQRLQQALPRMVTPGRERMTRLGHRLGRSLPLRFKPAQMATGRLAARLAETPGKMLMSRRGALSLLGPQLDRSVTRFHEGKRSEVDHHASLLSALGPANVLERGYTLTLDEQGGVVSSADQAGKLPRLRLRFADGDVDTAPLSAQGAEPVQPIQAGRKRRRGAAKTDGAHPLFDEGSTLD